MDSNGEILGNASGCGTWTFSAIYGDLHLQLLSSQGNYMDFWNLHVNPTQNLQVCNGCESITKAIFQQFLWVPVASPSPIGPTHFNTAAATNQQGQVIGTETWGGITNSLLWFVIRSCGHMTYSVVDISLACCVCVCVFWFWFVHVILVRWAKQVESVS